MCVPLSRQVSISSLHWFHPLEGMSTWPVFRISHPGRREAETADIHTTGSLTTSSPVWIGEIGTCSPCPLGKEEAHEGAQRSFLSRGILSKLTLCWTWCGSTWRFAFMMEVDLEITRVSWFCVWDVEPSGLELGLEASQQRFHEFRWERLVFVVVVGVIVVVIVVEEWCRESLLAADFEIVKTESVQTQKQT